ncbi:MULTISPECIES: hypothetical protein [Kordiimonas]|jgi:hypothetical protein|uniref:LTXXQ motif family protein n=1 Tax=Kordiimonas lacus TaxID=637679 RepID=A0A1G6VRV8_9PROT|nr:MULTISPECIES: hypothetical protein [Kordiimonas]SDD56342.1 hypothetical protein SAMN04488071_0834 [Kordiimonas lacus]
MKRTLIAVASFALIGSATALAGERMVGFDSLGTMMLEHEAEEVREVSYRSPELARCEQKEEEIRARLNDLNLNFAQSFSESFSQSFAKSDAVDMQAFESRIEAMTDRLSELKMQKLVQMGALQQSLSEHRAELDKYRKAFKDDALYAKVLSALEQAEQAMASE